MKNQLKKEKIKQPTRAQQVEQYEKLLHDIQLYSQIFPERLAKLIENIDNWSRAHRRGNGGFSNKERRDLINSYFWDLTNMEDGK